MRQTLKKVLFFQKNAFFLIKLFGISIKSCNFAAYSELEPTNSHY